MASFRLISIIFGSQVVIISKLRPLYVQFGCVPSQILVWAKVLNIIIFISKFTHHPINKKTHECGAVVIQVLGGLYKSS
tara:strand:- start:455 stop:691 length:237 start_codon:yes stop_codon:yes gene_type:complete